MTRDEAKDLLLQDNRYGIDWIIDDIFNEFEQKGCDTCSKKPKEGENFSDECGTCRYFYGSAWEEKDAV